MLNEDLTFEPSYKPTDWRLWLKYLRIWLPQIIALSLGIILIHMLTCDHYGTWHSWSWTSKFNFRLNALGSQSPFVMDAVMYISLLATIILIILGTLEYLWEVREASRSDRFAQAAFGITFFSIIVAVLWAAIIVFAPTDLSFLAGRGTPHHGIEYMSLAIFIMFAAIDLLFWISLKKELAKAEQRSKKVSKRLNEDDKAFIQRRKNSELERMDFDSKQVFSLESLLFIDLPVVIGVVMILKLSEHLIEEPSLQILTEYGRTFFGSDFNSQEEGKVFEAFIHGFSTGAIVMHLAFSQLIFGFLKSRNLYRRNKVGLANYFKVETN